MVYILPIRHSPHVANGHLNVANGFVSKYFKIRLFWIMDKTIEKFIRHNCGEHKNTVGHRWSIFYNNLKAHWYDTIINLEEKYGTDIWVVLLLTD